MNQGAAVLQPLSRQLAPIRQWWRALPSRERNLVMLAAGVLSLYLLWVLALQPALQTEGAAPRELATLEAQSQTMQSLAAEAAELRAAPPVNRDQATAALKAATERLGDAGKLSLQGDRAVLTLTNAGTAALRDWLAEARSGARARPVEASLSRAATGYSGTVVVAVGGSAP